MGPHAPHLRPPIAGAGYALFALSEVDVRDSTLRSSGVGTYDANYAPVSR